MTSQPILKQRLVDGKRFVGFTRLVVDPRLALGALMIALAAAGCASKAAPRASADANIAINGNVKYGTFVRHSLAKLEPQAPLARLYVAGDTLLGYTSNNTIYSMSSGLEVRYIEKIAADDVNVRRPIAYGDDTIYPLTTSLKVLNPSGQTVRTIPLPHPLTSDVRLDQRGLLLAGTVAPSGGRVSVIDPQLTVRPIVGDTLIGSVFSAPVGYQGIIYAATDSGEVYAIGADNRTAWPLPDMAFETSRSVKADLAIDEYGLFVASSDTTLYALDRTTGRIKWRYMAEEPLNQAPLLTADRLFQVVNRKGLVALDKIDGKLYREPLWVAPDITKVLSADADYVYAVKGSSTLVAIGIRDGQEKFDVSGNFTMFAAGANGQIFAANEAGVVASFAHGPYMGDNLASSK